MSKVIQLYKNSQLNIVANPEYEVTKIKIFWNNKEIYHGSDLLATYIGCYVGVRLYSPRFHGWMTPEMRIEILNALTTMEKLIYPYDSHTLHTTVKNHLKNGMKWFIDNDLKVTLGEDCIDPVETIRKIREEFFKSEKLVTHISLASDSDGDPKEDLFNVRLSEDVTTKTLHMCIMENNLPVSMFGKQWIDKAIVSFNQFKRVTKSPYTVYGTLEETRPNNITTDPRYTDIKNNSDISLFIGGNIVNMGGGSTPTAINRFEPIDPNTKMPYSDLPKFKDGE